MLRIPGKFKYGVGGRKGANCRGNMYMEHGSDVIAPQKAACVCHYHDAFTRREKNGL